MNIDFVKTPFTNNPTMNIHKGPIYNQNPTKDECQHKRDDWSKVLRETRDERIKNGEWFGHHKSDWRRTMTEKHDTDKCACGNDKRKSSYQCFECFRKPGGWEKSVSKGESLLAQGYKPTYTNPRKGKKKKKKKDYFFFLLFFLVLLTIRHDSIPDGACATAKFTFLPLFFFVTIL